MTPRSPMRFVGLLRAVNVGGKRKLPMERLRAIAADLGHTDVVTYIQSGNVVFDSRSRDEATVRGELEARLAAELGFEVPVVLRSVDAWTEMASRRPFPDAAADEVHVLFLADVPPADALDGLDGPFLPERAVLVERDVHVLLPNGVGRAKLPLAMGRRPALAGGTMRNRRTVDQLLELALR